MDTRVLRTIYKSHAVLHTKRKPIPEFKLKKKWRNNEMNNMAEKWPIVHRNVKPSQNIICLNVLKLTEFFIYCNWNRKKDGTLKLRPIQLKLLIAWLVTTIKFVDFTWWVVAVNEFACRVFNLNANSFHYISFCLFCTFFYSWERNIFQSIDEIKMLWLIV